MLTLLQAGGLDSAGSSAGAVRVLIVVGLLIVVVLVFGLIVVHLRKRLLKQDAGDQSQPLLLEDLRRMARRGEITDQEFEAMRRRMVEKLSGRSVPPLSASDAATSAPMKARPTTEKAPRPAPGDTRQAPPGFDLTGDPLPHPDHGE
jgi:hypothetical protein